MTVEPRLRGDVARIAFVDVLRGLSAVVVAIGHFTVLFLSAPQVVALLINAPALSAVASPWWYDALNTYFNLAAIGVAVFFLISGFVIPMSLDGSANQAFFIKRFMRIVPTYWVALACGVGALFVSAAFWSRPVPHSGLDYFANIFLITDFFGRVDIPSVMWTLMIEIKFYALAPLFYFLVRRGYFFGLLAWGAAVAGLYYLAMAGCAGEVAACWGHRGFISRIAWEPMLIGYMLIGTVFYAHFRGLVSTRRALAGIAFLFGCFAAAWPKSPLAMHGTQVYILAYGWGLVIFGGGYLLRERIRLTPTLQFFADISYPLYVVHPLVGYVAMRILMDYGAPYFVALACALILAFGLAWAIHSFVEAPSMELGKRLARRKARPASPALPASPRAGTP